MKKIMSFQSHIVSARTDLGEQLKWLNEQLDRVQAKLNEARAIEVHKTQIRPVGYTNRVYELENHRDDLIDKINQSVRWQDCLAEIVEEMQNK